MVLVVRNLCIQSLGGDDPLDEKLAPRPAVLARKKSHEQRSLASYIQSTGSKRTRQDSGGST